MTSYMPQYRPPQAVHPRGDTAATCRLLPNQEIAIRSTTAVICELLNETGIDRSILASRMAISRRRLDALLDGTTELTVRAVSDMLTHLGHVFRAGSTPQTTQRPQ